MPTLTSYHEYEEIPQDIGETTIRLLATHCKHLRELIISKIKASPEALELLRST